MKPKTQKDLLPLVQMLTRYGLVVYDHGLIEGEGKAQPCKNCGDTNWVGNSPFRCAICGNEEKNIYGKGKAHLRISLENISDNVRIIATNLHGRVVAFEWEL